MSCFSHAQACVRVCRLPTLILSECVLVYVKPEESAVRLIRCPHKSCFNARFPCIAHNLIVEQAVISWAAKNFTGGGVFVTYEQIKPHDEFGKMMMKNLAVSYARAV